MSPDVTEISSPWGPEGFPVADSTMFAAFGTKGSGKTTAGELLYRSWGDDKICIDVSGDIKPGPGATLISSLPLEFPARGWNNVPLDLYHLPDPGSETYFDDLDRGVGTILYPKAHRVLGWLDEIGEYTTGNKTGPHLRRLLMQSRHYNASTIMTGPRPMDINRLVISQADYIFIFDLPDPDDRERLAKTMGYPPKRFIAECEDTFRRGPYWYLFWDKPRKRLFRCPPFPAEWLTQAA
jgi:hypothetical protein